MGVAREGILFCYIVIFCVSRLVLGLNTDSGTIYLCMASVLGLEVALLVGGSQASSPSDTMGKEEGSLLLA